MSIKIIDEPGKKWGGVQAMVYINLKWSLIMLSEAGIKRIADTLAEQIIAQNGN